MAKRKSEKLDQVEIDLVGTGSSGVGDSELGQIRNLLFGKQAEETLERVNRVEREIMSALGDLAKSVDARFNEVDERFAAEMEARVASTSDLQGRIDSQSKVSKKEQIDLRATIDRRAEAISQQLGSARTELRDQIATVDAELREKNVDRASLAGLLEQVTAGLNASGS